jgi:hypothetical protein
MIINYGRCAVICGGGYPFEGAWSNPHPNEGIVDGKYFIIHNRAQSLAVMNAYTDTLIELIPLPNDAGGGSNNAAAILPLNNHIYITHNGGLDSFVYEYNPTTKAFTKITLEVGMYFGSGKIWDGFNGRYYLFDSLGSFIFYDLTSASHINDTDSITTLSFEFYSPNSAALDRMVFGSDFCFGGNIGTYFGSLKRGTRYSVTSSAGNYSACPMYFDPVNKRIGYVKQNGTEIKHYDMYELYDANGNVGNYQTANIPTSAINGPMFYHNNTPFNYGIPRSSGNPSQVAYNQLTGNLIQAGIVGGVAGLYASPDFGVSWSLITTSVYSQFNFSSSFPCNNAIM